MLFQLKKKNKENNQGTRLNNKIEKIKITLKKIKFVAKNVIYVRNWSKNPRLLGKIKTDNNFSKQFRKLISNMVLLN